MNLIRRAYLGPRAYTNGSLWSDFDELFESLSPKSGRAKASAFSPDSEVKENDNGYLLSFDIPGVKEEDIKIEFQDSILKVSGERKTEFFQENESHFRTEKSYGRFERQFRVPEAINESAVEANYKDGVLQVFLPKTPAKPTKQIEIKKNETSLLKKLFSKPEDQH